MPESNDFSDLFKFADDLSQEAMNRMRSVVNRFVHAPVAMPGQVSAGLPPSVMANIQAAVDAQRAQADAESLSASGSANQPVGHGGPAPAKTAYSQGAGALPATDIADAAYRAGFRGEALVTAVAIAMGESGGRPGVHGDVGLQNSTWGPSVGLWQIRTLKGETGTGGTRDINHLSDPYSNARSAYAISGGGTNFGPWTVYTKGIYRQHLGSARQAVAAKGYI